MILRLGREGIGGDKSCGNTKVLTCKLSFLLLDEERAGQYVGGSAPFLAPLGNLFTNLPCKNEQASARLSVSCN